MSETDNNSEVLDKLNVLINKIDEIEKTYISMNADLINQNIRMSEMVNGKLPEPPDVQTDIVKDLFYTKNNEDKIIVYGPGTFDKRPILRKFGEWNSSNKCWILNITYEELIKNFPHIVNKDIENKEEE